MPSPRPSECSMHSTRHCRSVSTKPPNRTDHPPPTLAIMETPQPDSPIVARAGRYYRNTRYIMGVVLIAMGLWFGYDGFKGWPEENRKVAQLESDLAEAQAAGDD